MHTLSARLTGASVTATDGPIGHVNAIYFDDQSWVIRYLVVETGHWLTGREVLISPYAVKLPLGSEKNIDVSLTRKRVKDSPDVDTHQPVSRQQERVYADFHGYPEYWAGDAIWGMGLYPMLPPYTPSSVEAAEARAMQQQDFQADDVHLRSSAKVKGYRIESNEGIIGHVDDFLFDEASWSIRYLVVDTRNWWPGGRRVLIATRWIDRIDWSTGSVSVSLSRDQIRNGPVYEEAKPIDRDYEQRLHDAYQRAAYWD